jgi:hypothetical protein
MSADDFTITFQGRHDRAPLIEAFFSWLKGIKLSANDNAGVVEDRKEILEALEWLKFVDEGMLARIGNSGIWDPEDVIDCMLSGEYRLVSLELSDDQTGVLRYDPHAFPFGGVDPLKAFLVLHGYEITGSSF